MTSKLKTDILETVSGSGTIALTNQLSGMTSASLPVGNVLDASLVTTNTSSAFTITTTTYQDIPDLTITMTPKSSSSQYLVQANIHHYIDNHAANAWSGTDFRIRKVIGGTDTLVYESFRDDGAAHGYTSANYVTDATSRSMMVTPIAYLDTHGASSGTVIYYIQAKSMVSGYGIRFGGNYGKSTLYAIEIQR
tara:strand:- start:54 stop:632 length:579 start_codon:yes stop_codon:yes gene_type:complete